MRKSYIRELMMWIAIIIALFMLIIMSLKDTFEFNNDNNFMLWFISLIVLVVMFVVNYLIRIIKIENKKIKVLLLTTPIIGITFSIIFANGAIGSYFWPINLIGIILGICIISLYNMYVYFYFQLNTKPLISIIIYNIISIIFSIKGSGIFYLYHYYLGMLIVIIPLAIVEMIIKNKIEKLYN